MAYYYTTKEINRNFLIIDKIKFLIRYMVCDLRPADKTRRHKNYHGKIKRHDAGLFKKANHRYKSSFPVTSVHSLLLGF